MEYSDIISYTDNLKKGMADKLFFLDHLPEEDYLFLDFGCADGSLIEALDKESRKHGRKHWFVGYDISEEMITLAKRKKKSRTLFTTSWEESVDYLKKQAQRHSFKTVLILSSVIHEVYSYNADIEAFWERVTMSGFDYVIVRDMMPSTTIDRVTDNVLYETFFKHQKKVLKPNQLVDFEQRWGSLKNNKNFIHFLLKYRWTINWEREVNENYFPIYIEELTKRIKPYQTLYLESFRVKFLDECIQKDFRLQLTDNTHVKAVFAKSN